jgi:hypothetical protein
VYKTAVNENCLVYFRVGKILGFLKKPAQWVFWGFLGFLGFLGFYLIFAQ